MMTSAFFCMGVTVLSLCLLSAPLLYFLIISLIADRVKGVRRSAGLGGFPVLPPVMTLRFAVLHHTEVASPHFDLMFETAEGSPLATWRSPTWPIEAATVIERLEDHRRDYLDYEGPVSNNRGEVQRVADGLVRIESRTDDQWIITTDQGLRLVLKRREDLVTWLAEVGQNA
jgi:hypothetical protein